MEVFYNPDDLKAGVKGNDVFADGVFQMHRSHGGFVHDDLIGIGIAPGETPTRREAHSHRLKKIVTAVKALEIDGALWIAAFPVDSISPKAAPGHIMGGK